LNPRFLEELENLKKETIGKLSPKVIRSTVLNGSMYVAYLRLIVQMINEEQTIYIYDAIEKVEAGETLNKIEKKYVDGLISKLASLCKMDTFRSSIIELTQQYKEELKAKIGKHLVDEYLEKFNSFKMEKDVEYIEKNKAKIREHNRSLAIGNWNRNIKPRVQNSNYFHSLEQFENLVAESKKSFECNAFDLTDQEADSIWEEVMKNVSYQSVRHFQQHLDKIESEKEKKLQEDRIKEFKNKILELTQKNSDLNRKCQKQEEEIKRLKEQVIIISILEFFKMHLFNV